MHWLHLQYSIKLLHWADTSEIRGKKETQIGARTFPSKAAGEADGLRRLMSEQKTVSAGFQASKWLITCQHKFKGFLIWIYQSKISGSQQGRGTWRRFSYVCVAPSYLSAVYTYTNYLLHKCPLLARASTPHNYVLQLKKKKFLC